MRYRAFFIGGGSLLLANDAFTLDLDNYLRNPSISSYLNPSTITYIIPEEESETGIAAMPTPDDLKTQRNKDMEAVLKDPKLLLKRATEKDHE